MPRKRIGVTLLPAIPPWEGMVIVPNDVTLRAGDAIRIRMTWRGEKAGIVVELDISAKDDPIEE